MTVSLTRHLLAFICSYSRLTPATQKMWEKKELETVFRLFWNNINQLMMDHPNQFLDEIISLPIDVIDNLINHEIKDRFDFNRDDCRNLKRYFKRTKAENKDAQLSEIFNKYTPPFAEMADRVMERRAFFTFDDKKEIYVYRNGVYVS